MNKSETLGELFTALSAFQGENIQPKKTRASNKGSYANIADYIDAAAPFLKSHGLSVSQLLTVIEGSQALRTILAHKSGEWIEDVTVLPKAEAVMSKNGGIVNTEAQVSGINITYFRRYAYAAILGMAAEDNDGSPAVFDFNQDWKDWVKDLATQGFNASQIRSEMKNKGINLTKEQTAQLITIIQSVSEQ